MSRPILRKFLYRAPEMREFLQRKQDLLEDADDCERNIKCQEAAAFSDLIRAFESTANFDLDDARNRARNAIIAEEEEALDPLFREYNDILNTCPRCNWNLSDCEGVCQCSPNYRNFHGFDKPCPYDDYPYDEVNYDYPDPEEIKREINHAAGYPVYPEVYDYSPGTGPGAWTREIVDYADWETKLELLDFAEEICADSEVREMMLILA